MNRKRVKCSDCGKPTTVASGRCIKCTKIHADKQLPGFVKIIMNRNDDEEAEP